jgi:hypothetical protein
MKTRPQVRSHTIRIAEASMTLRGHVKNGAVVLDEPVGLPDGTDVEVEVRPVGEAGGGGPSLYERLQDVVGSAEGLPEDMAANHDYYIHGTPKRPDRR